MSDIINLERIWDHLLSRDPQSIRKTFAGLDKDSRETVIAHLKEMAAGEGWHPGQVKSATIALEAILE